MKCPKCMKDDPQGREMCPDCGAPIRPIPVPAGGKIRFGPYDWFVLDKRDGKALLLTEKVIEQRAYHSRETEITWERCDMRQYLNEVFYHSFTVADRSRIIEAVHENCDNPWYGTSGGNPTADKVFLLSIEETVKYFGDSGQLKTRARNPGWDWCKDEFVPWIGDQYDFARRAVDDTGVVRFWRLRSPGANQRFVAAVTGFCADGFDQGGIDVGGPGARFADGHFMYDGTGSLTSCLSGEGHLNGVRPALWLSIE